MNYPLISEYVEAIKLAQDNLDKLSYLRPALDADGNPIMSSGNFAVVFKMKDERNGKLHALKCFIKEQEGRDEAYKLIADELEYVSSDFITPIKYLEKELFVDTSNIDVSEFPVLLMNWVEGLTLDKYIHEHLQDQYALHLITFQFCRLASWLMAQPFAHGDLKPDNIIVKADGTLVLVDYDGMFVPAMKGQKAREIGSPDFRHPLRTIDDFNEHIDDFSLATIAMQLYAIALQPNLLTSTKGDTLLLSEVDYRNLSKCQMMPCLLSLVNDAEFAKLLGLFFLSYSENSLSNVSFRTFNISKPIKPSAIQLSTEVTKIDLENGIADEFGALYSPDGKRLLRGVKSTSYHGIMSLSYHIKPGTQVICDNAFWFDTCLLSLITIPDSVTSIGDCAFSWCNSLTSITIPNSVTHIGNNAFTGCRRLTWITIPESVIHIGERAFSMCENMKRIIIPDSVINVGNGAFDGCDKLVSIIIPNGSIQRFQKLFRNHQDKLIIHDYWRISRITEVTNEDLANGVRDEYGAVYSPDGKRLLEAPERESYNIKPGTKVICNQAFSSCHIVHVYIPDSVTHIGKSAFYCCSKLTEITIPNSVTNIGFGAFEGCSSLTNITLSSSITQIESCTFSDCSNLSKISLPDFVTRIDDYAFDNCSKLTDIAIADSVTYIGDYAFNNCFKLANIRIPNSVKRIGESAFSNCHMIDIIIPNSVTCIENYAFCFCSSLITITIPNSITQIEEGTFFGCKNLKKIIIPDSVLHIGNGAFDECDALAEIHIPAGSYDKYKELLPNFKDILVQPPF